jgi:hypothetical protein
MSQIERQISSNKSITQPSSAGNAGSGPLFVDVACDDRRVQMGLEGHETVGNVKRRALGEMQIFSANPNRYITVGANRQPLDDNLAIRDILAQGQLLEFRLIPQVAFGKNLPEN